MWIAQTDICANYGPFQDMIEDPLWLDRMEEVALYCLSRWKQQQYFEQQEDEEEEV